MMYMYADMKMQILLKPTSNDAAKGDHIEIEAYYLLDLYTEHDWGACMVYLHSQSNPSRRVR
jgi:hypothetical protein